MRFPEWLYRLLPGDQGSQQLGIIWRQNSSTQNATTVGVTIYTVPADKCLVLTSASSHFDSHAASNVTRCRIMADPPDGTTRYNIRDYWTSLGGGSAGAAVGMDFSGEVVIPGGWKVRAEGEFTSAAAPGNEVSCEIHGYLIPRGTFVFG